MKTEKEIKKQIKVCKAEIKSYNDNFKTATTKNKKILTQFIHDTNYEISALSWVLSSNDDLPF